MPRTRRRRGRIGRSAAAALGVLSTLALLVGAALLTGLASLAGGALTSTGGLSGPGITGTAAGRSPATANLIPRSATKPATTKPATTKPATAATTRPAASRSATRGVLQVGGPGQPGARPGAVRANLASPRGAGIQSGDLTAPSWPDQTVVLTVTDHAGTTFPASRESGSPGVRAPPADRTA